MLLFNKLDFLLALLKDAMSLLPGNINFCLKISVLELSPNCARIISDHDVPLPIHPCFLLRGRCKKHCQVEVRKYVKINDVFIFFKFLIVHLISSTKKL
jgi:hypothetical protein